MKQCSGVSANGFRRDVTAATHSVWLMGAILMGLVLIAGIGFFEEQHHWLLGGLFFAAGFAVVATLFFFATLARVRASRSELRARAIRRRNLAIGMMSTAIGVLAFVLALSQLLQRPEGLSSTLPAQLGFSVAIAGGSWTVLSLMH